MVNFSFANINFDKYNRLAERLISNAQGIVVLDSQVELVWGDQQVAHWVSSTLQLQNNQRVESGNFTADNHRIYYAPIVDSDGFSHGLVCLSITEGSSQSEQDKDSIILEGFSIIVACICDELQANNELNSMATELAERYDELNLLYESGDNSSQPAGGKEELKKLVVNCSEYMDVDFAVLLMPEKKITCLESVPKRNNDANKIVDQLLTSVYPWAQENDKTLVISNTSDVLARKLFPDFPYKLISCPIHDGNGGVSGILVLLNDYEKVDFSNSDSNLLGVIALKAAKIVQATYDQLTGLLTRSSFEAVLDDLVENKATDLVEQCLVVINIAQLNVVNDAYGLQVGDELITDVGKLLEKELRNGDFVAHLSGGEFGVLLNCCSTIQAKQVAEKLQKKINKMQFMCDEEAIGVLVRVAIMPVPLSTSSRALMATADAAMDVAKKKGPNWIEVYSQSDEEVYARQSQKKWIQPIQAALRQDQFKLYCQGIFDGDESSEAHHYEILLRWLDSSGEIISPGEFLPAAEHYKLMPKIDRWVIQNTIKLLSEYSTELENSNLSWAINLSGQTISDPSFRECLINAIKSAPIPAHCLGFEITESSAIDNLTEAQNLMLSLKELGCKIYLDDFGTGLSSFGYLQSLPFDYVKIDGCFIRGIRQDPVSIAMVRAICDVAKAMGLGSVAEFVENREDIAYLQELGIDLLQGFSLHKPEGMELVMKNIQY